MTQEIKDKHRVSMVSVPWTYADEILYAGYEKARTAGRSGLEHFHEIRSVIQTVRPQPQRHPIHERLDSAAVREGAWRERSRRLLDEPELRFWFLDEDWIRPFLEQLEEAQSSRLVLNPMQKGERFATIVREAVKACCSGAAGAVLQRRMEDMALYFLAVERRPAAELALAVAQQIGEGDPGPLDIAFLTALAQKSFAFHRAKEENEPPAEPSLIVKP